MPITVRHDPSATAVAGLAALSGLTGQQNIEADRDQQAFLTIQGREQRDRQLTQQLRQQREMQMEQIGAQADRQKQAADDAMARTAMQYGLDGQIREDEFEREMASKQEDARIKASQIEWVFSAKDRQEFARYNTADRLIDSSPLLSQEEKQIAHREVALQRMGITGGAVPADPNKEIFPPGKGPKDIWLDENTGSYMGYDRNGNQVERIPFEDTPDGRKEKHEQTLELKQLEIQMKRDDARRAYAIKLEEMRVPTLTKPEKGFFTDEPGGEEVPGVERFLKESEKQALLEKHFPSGGVTAESQGPTDEQLEQELQQRADRQTPWWEAPERQGREILEKEKQAPPAIGQAMMLVREAENKYGTAGQIPSEILGKIAEADRLIERYRRSGGG